MMLTHDSRLEIKSLTATGMFSGYGSVYDVPDQCEDVVAAGCFSDSLAEWGAKSALPAMLWQHKSSEPIGAYTRMSEDPRGLYVEGQLAMMTQRGREAYDLLKMKAISGLSIGFMPAPDSVSRDNKTGVRTIKKADLWEVSLVTFPMQLAARVVDVKSLPDFMTIAEFERYLRDTGPYSRNAVMTLMQKAKKLFQRDTGVSVDAQAKAVLKAISRGASEMTGKAADDADTTPEIDDNCVLAGGCAMPGECCNDMGKCMAAAVGATGPT